MASTTTDAGMKPDEVFTPLSLPASKIEVFDAREEAHLAAVVLDLAADRLHHRGQAVAAEVRAVVVEDARLARLLPLHSANSSSTRHHVRPGAAAGQLAVGEGAGAALAEEVVALGVERRRRRRTAFTSRMRSFTSRAAFEHERPVAVPRQEVRADQPARPGADDHRPVRKRRRSRFRHRERRFVVRFDLHELAVARVATCCFVRRRDPPRSCRRTGVAACRGGRVPCGRCASGRCRRASPRERGRGGWAAGIRILRPGRRRLETRRDMKRF